MQAISGLDWNPLHRYSCVRVRQVPEELPRELVVASDAHQALEELASKLLPRRGELTQPNQPLCRWPVLLVLPPEHRAEDGND
jgi:hypothetical protein